ncbi:hypothetical protein Vretimale_2297 [Volvox reticuliferus]|uniref:Uncharacterized protein n=1 Tax=Volvox reticuliferus TaxID=1737510 RepID=A0A8J4C384_9CHLO|nr:hypothetical protein Vretifemale_4585 [Volvox reticuliferus]GIL96506.1 hypothetical protein Vretimale_2297 [Volvox reticuliferus]
MLLTFKKQRILQLIIRWAMLSSQACEASCTPASTQVEQQAQPVCYEDCLKLARTQRYVEAVGSFEALLSCEPGNDKAWISYAQMSKRRYMQQGAPSLAYQACGAVLDRGLSASPQSAKLWQARGLMELQRGNKKEARELLERAVSLDGSLSHVLKWQTLAGSQGKPAEEH